MNNKNISIKSTLDYLSSFSSPGDNIEERKNYLNGALDRILKTFAMIPDCLDEKSRVLELGAHPYFLSLLLKKNHDYKIDFANYFGKTLRTPSKHQLASKKYKEKFEFAYKTFNVEKDTFPYRKGEFDLVLFCEIIEHLTADPVHSLVQINRILKEKGLLLITTPNALRYLNILKLIKGENIHDHYSGYGPYGRHNREYTPGELVLLVESLGFKVVKCVTKATGPVEVKGFSIKRWRRLIQFFTTNNRGGNIFLLAEKVKDTDYVYPGWLFESMHAVKKRIT